MSEGPTDADAVSMYAVQDYMVQWFKSTNKIVVFKDGQVLKVVYSVLEGVAYIVARRIPDDRGVDSQPIWGRKILL